MTDAIAPFVYIPNYICYADEVFDRLWAELDWVKHEDRPRREYWWNDFNAPYTYGSGVGARTYQPQAPHPIVEEIRDQLDKEIGVYFEACFLNGYDGPRQHLGWHADDDPKIDHSRPIAVVSVGDPREIWIRPIDDREAITKIMLAPGSLFLMNAGMQQTHLHRIPKSDRACKPRISLTYRGLMAMEGEA